MSTPKILKCPSCGGQNEITGDEAQATCNYCGNTITVPEEMRNKPQPPPVEIVQPRVVVVQTPVMTPAPVVKVTTRTGGFPCGCLMPLIMLIIIGGILYSTGAIKSSVVDSYLPSALKTAIPQVPGALQSAAVGGFARRVSSFGAEGTAPGFFQNARHIAVDGAGNIFVSDQGTLRIQRFDKDGKLLNFWTIDAKGASKTGPGKLAADFDGNLYVIWSQMLLKYEGATGKLLKTITGDSISKSASIPEEIADVAVLPNGQFLTLNGLGIGDDLVRYDKDGRVISRTAKIVSTQKGDSVFLSSLHMAVDGLGNLFIVDTFPSQPAVYKFSPDGKYINRFGGKGDKPGQFTSLGDSIAVDAKSRVYVRDTSKVQVFDSDGRYLDMIPNSLYGYVMQDMAFHNNDLYVVSQNTVIQFSVSDAAR